MRLFRPILCLLATLACLSFFSYSAFAAETGGKKFAVEPRNGVPVFTIDGVPTRSRIFFGLNGEQPLVFTPEYTRYENEFVAEDDGRRKGTIHFRFGIAPGEIDIDNFAITEKETGKIVAGPYSFEDKEEFSQNWQVWHDVFEGRRVASTAIEKGVGTDGSRGLRVKIFQIPENQSPDFHLYHAPTLDIVQGKTYVVSFDARSSNPRNVRVVLYRPESPVFARVGSCGKNVLESQVKLAAGAGVNFVSFMPRQLIWIDSNGACDFSELDSLCDMILKANPHALLIPRLRLDPPPAWLAANPDVREVWHNAGADHDRQGWNWPSLSSEKYRKTANATLAAIVRHMETKYGDSVAGYHPCGQNTSEWFTPNTWTAGDAGFSEVDRVAFRNWLKNKYSDVESLRQAWNNPQATFENADVPSSEERLASRDKPYLEPGKLLDFNDFWQTQVTDVLCELAHTVKKETNGKKLAFFFYGYSYEFSTVSKGPAASGHYALLKLLESPDVDVVCSPISYSDRALGGGCSCMLNAESVTAAGKIYLYEDDSRTYIAHDHGERLASVATVEDSVNIVLRNSSETAERNFATWLMDLGATGWYDSPEIWAAAAKLAPMDEYFLAHPTPYRPEIGLFLGERSMLKISSGSYSGAAVSLVREQFNRVGAPYAQYDLADLTSGKAPLPKLSFILNADAIDDEEKANLDALEREGKTRVVRLALKKPTTDEIRAIAKVAGVWLYTDRPCNVWANLPFVTLHAPEDGEYRFNAPEGTRQIIDFISGETLAQGSFFVFNLKKGDTKVLRLDR